jgi:hypothetical protein
MAITIKRTSVKSKIAKAREQLTNETIGKEAVKIKHKVKNGKGVRAFSKEELDDIANDVLGSRTPRATDEALEFRRKQILRLLLRGVPKKTIAEHLSIKTDTLYRDIAAINSGLKEEIGNMDLQLFVGMTVSFYDEVRNIGLRMATDTNEKDKRIQLNALRVALDAETDKHRYLLMTGLYGEVINKAEVYHHLSREGSGRSDIDEFNLFLNDIARDPEIRL